MRLIKKYTIQLITKQTIQQITKYERNKYIDNTEDNEKDNEVDKEKDNQEDNEIDNKVDKEIDNEVDKEIDNEVDKEIDNEVDKEIDNEVDKEYNSFALTLTNYTQLLIVMAQEVIVHDRNQTTGQKLGSDVLVLLQRSPTTVDSKHNEEGYIRLDSVADKEDEIPSQYQHTFHCDAILRKGHDIDVYTCRQYVKM